LDDRKTNARFIILTSKLKTVMG